MTFSKLLNESKDEFPSDFLSNISNTTCEGITLDSQVIGVGIFLAVFILVAIVGNILVILSVLCNKHLQTVTNFFIVNLAIADLLLSIIVLPFSASLECWDAGCSVGSSATSGQRWMCSAARRLF
ncbi:hypothetical protein QQF64_000798 [Cirrhinus molitorella]|uniref:G-protein coupled receptors family 1 profile domain-containing protein n=1 Tax=Cirrhinus molitorella TaxID=172907 RepID=A0ABR3NZT2_9TELE